MQVLDPAWEQVGEQLVALAQAAGMWAQPEVKRAVSLAVLRKNKERASFLQRTFEKRLLANGAQLHPFLPDPEPEFLVGDIYVGSLVSGGEVALPVQDLLLNLFISGPPRQGKSVLVTQLVKQLLHLGIPVHVFDTQGEYPDVLAPLFPATKLECVDVRDCRLNPFVGPSNMSHRDWVMGPMCDYLREALWWRDRTIELFRSICLKLLEKKVEPITPPIFVEAFSKVPNYKKNTSEFGSLQRFVTMIRTLETFQCLRGEKIEELARKSRIYDLWNVSKDVRLFFVSHMMTLHKAARRFKRDRGLEMVFVFDELSQFITKEAVAAKADLGESFFLELLRTGRKMGIGCILADQTYSLIHQVVRTNCQSKVVFQTSDGPSRWEVSRDFALSREQQEFLAALSFQQRQRRAVAQVPSYPHAFLLEIENVRKPRPLSSRQADARREAVVAGMDWEPLPCERLKAEVQEEKVEKSSGVLPDKLLQVLKSVVSNYFAPQQEHAAQLGIAESTFSKHAKQLKDSGLLRKEVINKGTRGGMVKILLPTKQGYEYLDQAEIPYKKIPGNGSIEHRFWQHQILRQVGQEADVAGVEIALQKKRVDVGIIKNGRRVAYEVVIEGLQKELSNLEKDLREGWSKVVFCVKSEEEAQILEVLLSETSLATDERFEVKLLKEFA